MNVLICDDEPLARERMRTMLERIEGIRPLAEEASDGEHALELIRRLSPDVVLLDIQMPGYNGLNCATQIAEMPTPPAVIFCTAHNDYALDAFKAQADDYLLKPVRQQHLEEALERAQRLSRPQLSAIKKEQNIPKPEQAGYISAKSHKGVELIPVKAITLFHARDKYVTVCYDQGEVLIHDSLKSLQERMGDQFIRIHRNALVAQKAIASMERNPQGCYELRIHGQKHPIAISRRHLPAIRRLLKNLSG